MGENMGMPYLVLKWKGDSTPIEPGEPEDFVYEYNGNIYSLGDDGKEKIVGRFRVFYVDLDGSGGTAFDTLDARQETFVYFQALFNIKSDDYKNSIYSLVYDVVGRNLLILDRVEILPGFRGKSLALIVMKRLIERFGQGAGIVALKAYPLQFEADNGNDTWGDKMRLNSFDRDEKASTAKLKRHYRRLGFLSVRGTPFMVRSTVFELPSLKDLLCN